MITTSQQKVVESGCRQACVQFSKQCCIQYLSDCYLGIFIKIMKIRTNTTGWNMR